MTPRDGIDADELRRLLDAAPEDTQRPGRRLLGEAEFGGVTFSGDADFSDVSFSGDANFRGAKFEGSARFEQVTFEGRADFKDTTWNGEARFIDATFGEVLLDGAVFKRRLRLELCASSLSADRAEFLAGTDILVTHPVESTRAADAAAAEPAGVTFERTTFAAPSTLGPPTRGDPSQARSIPRVVSLRGARVVDLTLSGVDLRLCEFRGAHGLESLRLEQVLLAEPPTRTKSRRWPFKVWWTRRVAIAEEHRWRAAEGFGWPWPSGDPTPTPTPHQIAAIYRALRKGREERKDEPGAADFYYGEMEMRRHSTYESDEALESKPRYKAPSLNAWLNYDNTRRTPRAEKFVLWLYWLVSGYGLRASRALVALALTVLLFGVLFSLGGIRGGASLWDALIFSLQSSTSLFRAPREQLSDGGKLLEIGLRLLGPLFFGLALLSLRGRVKR